MESVVEVGSKGSLLNGRREIGIGGGVHAQIISLSMSPEGSAAQLTRINGLLQRALKS